jgi:hypothetical protein
MTTKVVKIIKQVSFVLLIGIISCESDIEGVGVNIVDNGVFETNSYSSELISYNNNIENVKSNQLGQYLLGVYKNDDFGQIEASIVSQLTHNTSLFTGFGDSPSIDAVILSIPYQATRQAEDNDNGSPKFEIDSVFGNKDVAYNLSVYEVETYLNTLDPSDPSEELDYYSDQTYAFNSNALYAELFNPNEQDTVLYIDRPGIILDLDTMEHDVDTIKITGVLPFIQIPLDKDFFTNEFLINPSAFESTTTFVDFFRGLLIQATPASDPDASITALDLSLANMSIYYTNDVDGVKTKQTAVFNFSGVTSNIYQRDYTSSNVEPFIPSSPNTTTGDEKLYLQGAAGSMALIDLFGDDNIEELRNNNWLINQANLIFYIDQSSDVSLLPERLFLYNYEEDIQLTDVLTETATYDGFLENDEDGNPWRYKINITDYVSNVLKSDDPLEPTKLGLKVFNISDFPTAFGDVDVRDLSWTIKGVVVHGNNTTDIDKRSKLEIIYSEIN